MASTAVTHVTTTNATIPNGINVFYRTAGPQDGPVVLLLHGFPASSFQFRNLIPILANVGYRVIAPDLPGFGFTTIPSSLGYKHTFANLATTVGSFLDVLSIQRFAVYVFDYGAPTGFRLALERPDAVTAIFSQNGNAYDAGLGAFWDPLRVLWKTADGSSEEAAQKQVVQGAILTYEATKWQYTEHEPHAELVDPASWTLDWALMSQPGNFDVQLSLFKDYGTNVKLYPQFQEWMKSSKVPVLAVWGKDDEIFIAPGAEAFRELPNAQVELVPGGHFLVEAQTELVAEKMVAFLKENVPV
jgi:pimeloyl-ACP methyl ester carboxylesterase